MKKKLFFSWLLWHDAALFMFLNFNDDDLSDWFENACISVVFSCLQNTVLDSIARIEFNHSGAKLKAIHGSFVEVDSIKWNYFIENMLPHYNCQAIGALVYRNVKNIVGMWILSMYIWVSMNTMWNCSVYFKITCT